MNISTISFNKYLAIALLAAMFLVPVQAIFAQTLDVSVEEKSSIFTSLRERQINSREKIKVNLLQMLSSEDEKETSSLEAKEEIAPAPTAASVSTSAMIAQETVPSPSYDLSALATITYRLTDIADRLESRMLILKSQGVAIPQEVSTNLALARAGLENILLQLMLPEGEIVATNTVLDELTEIRTQLQNVITGLKLVLAQ